MLILVFILRKISFPSTFCSISLIFLKRGHSCRCQLSREARNDQRTCPESVFGIDLFYLSTLCVHMILFSYFPVFPLVLLFKRYDQFLIIPQNFEICKLPWCRGKSLQKNLWGVGRGGILELQGQLTVCLKQTKQTNKLPW
jgi:hypothetical protein